MMAAPSDHRELHNEIGIRLLVIEAMLQKMIATETINLSDEDFDREENRRIEALAHPADPPPSTAAAEALLAISQDLEAQARKMFREVRRMRAQLRASG